VWNRWRTGLHTQRDQGILRQCSGTARRGWVGRNRGRCTQGGSADNCRHRCRQQGSPRYCTLCSGAVTAAATHAVRLADEESLARELRPKLAEVPEHGHKSTVSSPSSNNRETSNVSPIGPMGKVVVRVRPLSADDGLSTRCECRASAIRGFLQRRRRHRRQHLREFSIGVGSEHHPLFRACRPVAVEAGRVCG
jgi:hypothetical protein